MMGAMNQLGAANNGQAALPPGFVADALLAAAQPSGTQTSAQFENVVAAAQLDDEADQPQQKLSCLCPACGTQNEADAGFCDSCGQRLNNGSL